MTQRVFFSAAIVLLCGCCAITVTSAPPGRALASVVMSGRASSQANEFVYVANGSGPVTAYQSGSLGKVEPALLINNPKLSNTYWDLWDVVFDRLGNLYAQTFLSDATTFVFAPHAHGDAKPIRVFMGGGPDTRSVAVDSAGYEYIATSESSSEINVLPPKANGQSGNLYYVMPLRTIYTDEAVWFPWSGILTTDSHDDVVASIVRYPQNAVEVYPGGPSGSGGPIRTITGSKTQLGSCGSNCENLTTTFSRYTSRIYVGVTSIAGSRILVFAEGANGNAVPLQAIEGTETRLGTKAITGLAVSGRTGEIYAMVKGAQFGAQGVINVYARTANGNISPERSFTDADNRFYNSLGIGITR